MTFKYMALILYGIYGRNLRPKSASLYGKTPRTFV